MAPCYSLQAPSEPCAESRLLPLLQTISSDQTSEQVQRNGDFFPYSSILHISKGNCGVGLPTATGVP